jgi:hypothetical protein
MDTEKPRPLVGYRENQDTKKENPVDPKKFKEELSKVQESDAAQQQGKRNLKKSEEEGEDDMGVQAPPPAPAGLFSMLMSPGSSDNLLTPKTPQNIRQTAAPTTSSTFNIEEMPADSAPSSAEPPPPTSAFPPTAAEPPSGSFPLPPGSSFSENLPPPTDPTPPPTSNAATTPQAQPTPSDATPAPTPSTTATPIETPLSPYQQPPTADTQVSSIKETTSTQASPTRIQKKQTTDTSLLSTKHPSSAQLIKQKQNKVLNLNLGTKKPETETPAQQKKTAPVQNPTPKQPATAAAPKNEETKPLEPPQAKQPTELPKPLTPALPPTQPPKELSTPPIAALPSATQPKEEAKTLTPALPPTQPPKELSKPPIAALPSGKQPTELPKALKTTLPPSQQSAERPTSPTKLPSSHTPAELPKAPITLPSSKQSAETSKPSTTLPPIPQEATAHASQIAKEPTPQIAPPIKHSIIDKKTSPAPTHSVFSATNEHGLSIKTDTGSSHDHPKKQDKDNVADDALAAGQIPTPLVSFSPPPTEPLPAYTKLPSEVYELFERMVGSITVEHGKASTTTTITLAMKGSIFDGTQIILDRQSSSMNTFNIQIATNPQAQDLVNANLEDLVAAFQGSKLAFDVNIRKPVLLEKYHDFQRKESPQKEKEKEQES